MPQGCCMALVALVAIVSFLARPPAAAAATPPIILSDNLLYDSSSLQQFSCRGVAFTPATLTETSNQVDFFLDSEEATWSPFVALMANLSVNCVRLYQVCNVNDPETLSGTIPCGPHDAFMNALAAAGIYAIVPVVSGGQFYSNTMRADLPAGNGSSPNECYGSWRGQLLFQTAAARVADFAKYSNTLAFVVGNELLINGYYPVEAQAAGVDTGIFAFPCAKALSRDLKWYMQNSGLRAVPTMYAMQNPSMGTDPVVQTILHEAVYLACTSSSSIMDAIDILGINVYNWCNLDDTYVSSGYAGIQQEFVNANINAPVMFSEYGCNFNDFTSNYPWTSDYRTWIQVPCIFNTSEMASSFSGGIAYTLVMEPGMMTANDPAGSFGIVATAAAGNTAPSQPSIYPLPSYYALQGQYQAVAATAATNAPILTSSPSRWASACPQLSEQTMYTWFQAYQLTDGTARTGPGINGLPFWNSTYDMAAEYLASGGSPPPQYNGTFVSPPSLSPSGSGSTIAEGATPPPVSPSWTPPPSPLVPPPRMPSPTPPVSPSGTLQLPPSLSPPSLLSPPPPAGTFLLPPLLSPPPLLSLPPQSSPPPSVSPPGTLLSPPPLSPPGMLLSVSPPPSVPPPGTLLSPPPLSPSGTGSTVATTPPSVSPSGIAEVAGLSSPPVSPPPAFQPSTSSSSLTRPASTSRVVAGAFALSAAMAMIQKRFF